MKPAYSRTLLLLLIIAASGIILVGALAKIQRWPSANMLMGTGLLLEIGCAVGLVISSWQARKQ